LDDVHSTIIDYGHLPAEESKDSTPIKRAS